MIKITERAATLEDFLRGKGLTDKNGKKAYLIKQSVHVHLSS